MLPYAGKVLAGFDPLGATPRRCLKRGLSSVPDLITLDHAIETARGCRLAILLLLTTWGPTTVRRLVATLGVPIYTISKELEKLERLGLVTWNRDKTSHHYRLMSDAHARSKADGSVQLTLMTKTGDWLTLNRNAPAIGCPVAAASDNLMALPGVACDTSGRRVSTRVGHSIPNLEHALDTLRGHRLDIVCALAGTCTGVRDIAVDDDIFDQGRSDRRALVHHSNEQGEAHDPKSLAGLCVSDIATKLMLPVCSISHDLEKLDRCGLVSCVVCKRRRVYRLTPRTQAIAQEGLVQIKLFADDGDWLFLHRDERPPAASSPGATSRRMLPPDGWISPDASGTNSLIGRWVDE